MGALRVTTKTSLYKPPDVPFISETTLASNTPVTLTEKTIKSTEVATHNTSDSIYMTIHGKVYDLTDFQNVHPGGQKILQKHAGKDATKAFQKYHRDGILLSHEEKVVGLIAEDKPEKTRSVLGWVRRKS